MTAEKATVPDFRAMRDNAFAAPVPLRKSNPLQKIDPISGVSHSK